MQDFRQILTENSYIRQEEVIFGQCDRNEKLRMAGLLDKIACFGGYEYDARGLTREMLMEQGVVYLLSRVAIRIHSQPGYRDVLTVQTWENGPRGAHVQRVFEMTDQTGRLCVSARSDWVLADPVNHRVLRPRTIAHQTFITCPKTIDCPEPKRLLPLRGDLEELGVRTVVWSDLDGNGHLYSGRYGDLIWDYLPEDVRERRLTEFYINYNKEATLGQVLQIQGSREENGYQIQGIGDQGVCFSALCRFVPSALASPIIAAVGTVPAAGGTVAKNQIQQD